MSTFAAPVSARSRFTCCATACAVVTFDWAELWLNARGATG
jgi:hypothetical protein